MSNFQYKAKRLEKFRQTLTNKDLQGGVIKSSPNFNYFLGFATESPSLIFIPNSDIDVAPTVFTTPLEEEITKANLPFKEFETIIMLKSVDARSSAELKAGKFAKFQFNGTETLIPSSTLKLILKNHFQHQAGDITPGEDHQIPFEINSVPMQQIFTKSIDNFEVMTTEWDGQKVLVPRIGNLAQICHLLHENNLTKIGIENHEITYRDFLQFNQSYKKIDNSDLKISDIGEAIYDQRIIKDLDEIEVLKQAAAIGDKGFAAAEKAIHELKSEIEVQAAAEYAMKVAGSTKPSFDTIVVSGLNGAFPHGHATEKKINKGELVTVDIGAFYKGYNSDMTRTIFAGHEEPEKLLNVLKSVNQAQQIGLEKIRPGTSWAAPDEAVRKFFNDKGILQYYNHSLGHGVGVEVHEMPGISYRYKIMPKKLEVGMVLTVEPGLYIPGLGGARTEDTVLVTENGYEKFNHSPYLHYTD